MITPVEYISWAVGMVAAGAVAWLGASPEYLWGYALMDALLLFGVSFYVIEVKGIKYEH